MIFIQQKISFDQILKKGNVEIIFGRNILCFWQIKKHNWFTTDGPALSPVVPIYYWQSANNNQLKQQQACKMTTYEK